MQFTKSTIIAFAALLASADASYHARRFDNGTVYTTEVVTAYTTICPSPTTIVQNNVTYTVSSSTTLTITNCPCTITRSTQLPTSIAISVTPVGPTTTTSLTNPSLTTSSSITRATGAAATAGIAGTFGALIMGGLAAALL